MFGVSGGPQRLPNWQQVQASGPTCNTILKHVANFVSKNGWVGQINGSFQVRPAGQTCRRRRKLFVCMALRGTHADLDHR